MYFKYQVEGQDSGKTVKHILKKRLQISERLIKKLKTGNRILCNSSPIRVVDVLKDGDILEVFADFPEEAGDVIPEDIPIDILYEDDCLVALDKRPGMVVHPTFNHPCGTVANALMYHFLSKGITRKIRPVSRLDKDTSGIIIFAKNQYTQEFLIQQMKNKTFLKEYVAIVHGLFPHSKGTIDLPIARKPDSIMLRHISSEGDPSITHYQVLEYLDNATYVRFRLETGRTHQIRVHCQALGHPIIGDNLYSDVDTGLINRQCLHSRMVSFIHPMTREKLEITSPVPEDFRKVLEILRK
jgi:23S rRNA pseudouridine1911/1915/1917 synthase